MKRKRADGAGESRIVAHIDLDCFYVQVERSIHPALKDKAVGVVQYNPFGDLKSYSAEENRIVQSGSLIAVSYEARARGVKRNMRGAEAKKVCPEMILVQVPTSHGKADLTIYRDASARILTVLCSKYPSCIVERSSIDEVYLDVSVEAARMLEQTDSDTFLHEAIHTLLAVPSMIAGDDTTEVLMSRRQISKGHSGTELLAGSYNQGHNNSDTTNTTNTIHTDNTISTWFTRPHSQWSTEDKLMLCGALIVNTLRRAVYTELGFTCSAGISNNKVLAKLSSAMHKPNKQTLAPACVIPKLMENLPINRIQGLGGKLGQSIESIYGEKVRTMGQLLLVPKSELSMHFNDETATWLHSIACGIDNEPVLNRSLPISIGCSKSFRTSMMLTPSMILDGTVLHWLTQLAGELQERVSADTKANSRVPRNLHCGASVKIFPNGEMPTSFNNNTNTTNANSTSNTITTTNPNSTTTTNNTTTTSNTTETDEVADWHEQAGFSLSKIVPLQANSTTANTARTAFNMLVRTILEHPKFTSVYGNVQVPALASIVANGSVSSTSNTYYTDTTSISNPNTTNNTINTTTNSTNTTTTSAINTTHSNNNTTASPTKNSRLMNTSSISSPPIEKHSPAYTLPTGWTITGLSLGAANFTTIESGASSIKSYFGTAKGSGSGVSVSTGSGSTVKGSTGSVSGRDSCGDISNDSSGGTGSGSTGYSSGSGNSSTIVSNSSAENKRTTTTTTTTDTPLIKSQRSDMFALQREIHTNSSIHTTSTNTNAAITTTNANTSTTSAANATVLPVPPVAVSIRDLLLKQPHKHTLNNTITNTTTNNTGVINTNNTNNTHSTSINNTYNTNNTYDLTDVTDLTSEPDRMSSGADIRSWVRNSTATASAGVRACAGGSSGGIDGSSSSSSSGEQENSVVNVDYMTTHTADITTTIPTSTHTTATTIPVPTHTHNQHQPQCMGDIDSAVFLTLPPHIQREIELTLKLRQRQSQTQSQTLVQSQYSVHTRVQSVCDKTKSGIFGLSSGSSKSSSGSGGSSIGMNNTEHSTTTIASSTKKETHQPDSMTDIDSAVFLSLPADIQREIELTLKLRQQRRNSGASTHIHRPSKPISK